MCGINGECKNGKCYCSKGFKGEHCNVTDTSLACSQDSDCSGTCEVCSETEGKCVLKDLCCGNGVFMEKCHCKPGFSGSMCESRGTDVTYRWVVGEFEKCREPCGPRGDIGRTKVREVNCYRFTPDGRRDTQVSSVHCSIERPEDRVPCNQFECESSKVVLIDLTLDMDYESSLYPVSNGEQSFVEFLKEDIQNHGAGGEQI